MIKFDVLHRLSNDVHFTADIDCQECEERSIKLRAAVIWAIHNGVNLDDADLNRADLNGVKMTECSLVGADLTGTNLTRADLNGVNLTGCILIGANLYRANLNDANLNDANLNRANFNGARLTGCSLIGANLHDANGNNREIKTLQTGLYVVNYTDTFIQIACEQHTIKQWFEFSNEEIDAMESRALAWWTKWKPILKTVVDVSDETWSRMYSKNA